MYTIIFGAIALLFFYAISAVNPKDAGSRLQGQREQQGQQEQQGGMVNDTKPMALDTGKTVCSPGSDRVTETRVEQVEPVQRCLSGLRMTRAGEDQLNIVNHREHNNLDWVLRKPLGCARKRINCLKETPSTPVERLDAEPAPISFPEWQTGSCDRGLMNIDPCNAPPGGLESGEKAPQLSDSTKAVLDHLSPLFMRTSLKEYYGGMYYHDFRYPREPISLEFAVDPEGFCRRNPTRYPCDIRASRYDLK